jgi:hypothetical protein
MKYPGYSMAAAMLAILILATGCASVGGDGPYGYKPSGGIGDHGYSEIRHKDSVWIVTYTGYVGQSYEQVNVNFLRRAEEMCSQSGYADFDVKDPRWADQTVGGGTTYTGVSLTKSGGKVVNIGTSSDGLEWPSITGHALCK